YLLLYYFFVLVFCVFFFSSRRRHTRFSRDWSSDVCSSDLRRRGRRRRTSPHSRWWCATSCGCAGRKSSSGGLLLACDGAERENRLGVGGHGAARGLPLGDIVTDHALQFGVTAAGQTGHRRRRNPGEQALEHTVSPVVVVELIGRERPECGRHESGV